MAFEKGVDVALFPELHQIIEQRDAPPAAALQEADVKLWEAPRDTGNEKGPRGSEA